MNRWKYRLGVLLAVSVGLMPLWAGRADGPPALKNDFFQGKVVPLGDALAKFGVKLDADAAAQLALASDDGKINPLVKDEGARMFYQDKTLRNRPMRLTARLLPGTSMLQIVYVHSYKQGKLHDVYYWCDICTIRGYQLTICDCCGGPMELREVPVVEKKL